MRKAITVLFVIAISISSCSVNKAKIDDQLSRYFDNYNVEGCFALLNNADGKITVYNMGMDTMRYLPASTFKIVSSLIGLESGIITDEKMVIRWDGVKRNPNWDKNMSMADAFKVNNVPYFQEVVRRIGKDSMQFWMNTLSYGNKKMDGPVDSFWLNNSLKISPDEQLGLMKKLYFNQLPFRKGVQETVRALMLQEDNTAYKFSYKTANALDEQGMPVGWTCGWIEENKHVYFFVNFVKAKSKGTDMQSVPLNVTRDILKEYGFFQGKK